MKLSDLKIIVTGAGGGMGAHFAKRLHEAGAQVAVGDVNEGGLNELPAGIHKRKLDVASDADIEAFVTWAEQQMGGLNGLINNAGILRDGLLVKKDKETGAIKKLDRAAWDAVIGVNLTGATWMVREVVGKMAEKGHKPGVVVNMSSLAREAFGTYLAFGLTCIFALQALVNTAVVLGAIPAKGLTLPFVSYGGTSLITSMFMAGVILNVSRRAPAPKSVSACAVPRTPRAGTCHETSRRSCPMMCVCGWFACARLGRVWMRTSARVRVWP